MQEQMEYWPQIPITLAYNVYKNRSNCDHLE